MIFTNILLILIIITLVGIDNYQAKGDNSMHKAQMAILRKQMELLIEIKDTLKSRR